MRALTQYLMVVALLFSVAACSSARQQLQPILVRDNRNLSVGDSSVAQDLRACRDKVREAAPLTIQPRWLPPLGVATNGVVLGTVEFPHPVWPSREAYRHAIELCMTARGYEVHGWQQP